MILWSTVFLFWKCPTPAGWRSPWEVDPHFLQTMLCFVLSSSSLFRAVLREITDRTCQKLSPRKFCITVRTSLLKPRCSTHALVYQLYSVRRHKMSASAATISEYYTNLLLRNGLRRRSCWVIMRWKRRFYNVDSLTLGHSTNRPWCSIVKRLP